MFKEAYRFGHLAASHLPYLNDPERRHDIVVDLVHNLLEPNPRALAILEGYFTEGEGRVQDGRLRTSLASGQLLVENPFMVAAGLDKDGKMVLALYTLGASLIEVGSVLFRPQKGNSRPRLHEPTPKTLINAMGFNSEGVFAVREYLKRYKDSDIPIGINIGLNKIALQDQERFPEKLYPYLFAWVAELLCDQASYFVINVSSPNTPGLRGLLQEEGFLNDVIWAMQEVMRKKGVCKPLYIKLSPDLDPQGTEKVGGVILRHKLAGAICSNTTVNSEIKADLGQQWVDVKGGVSGANPMYRSLVLRQIAQVYRLTQGSVDIIACGGLDGFEPVVNAAYAGANAFQLLTPLTRRKPGPFVFHNLIRDSISWMDRVGIKNFNAIRGLHADKFT